MDYVDPNWNIQSFYKPLQMEKQILFDYLFRQDSL